MSAAQMTRSLYQVVRIELDLHKWLESEKAGKDKGEEAIRDWVKHHWDRFLRVCWLEHIEGKVFWTELGQENFGICRQDFEHDWLAGEIVELFKRGGNDGENLGILMIAEDLGWPKDHVFYVLETIDINSYRLVRQIQERLIVEFRLARDEYFYGAFGLTG
jgi:hypothetical protein